LASEYPFEKAILISLQKPLKSLVLENIERSIMGFEKGHTHAVGRPKGSLNKNTTKVRELFKDLILENYEQLKCDLGELELLDRIKMIIELSKFVLPAFKTIDRKDIVNDLGWGMNDDKWS
tara:strand:+ start:571 stop:933 length:363 start_codon:yes stop_codon:yes gene_type:complete